MYSSNRYLTGQDDRKRKRSLSPVREIVTDTTSSDGQADLSAQHDIQSNIPSRMPMEDIQDAVGEAPPSSSHSAGQYIPVDVLKHQDDRVFPWRREAAYSPAHATHHLPQGEIHVSGWGSHADSSYIDTRAVKGARTPVWKRDPLVNRSAIVPGPLPQEGSRVPIWKRNQSVNSEAMNPYTPTPEGGRTPIWKREASMNSLATLTNPSALEGAWTPIWMRDPSVNRSALPTNLPTVSSHSLSAQQDPRTPPWVRDPSVNRSALPTHLPTRVDQPSPATDPPIDYDHDSEHVPAYFSAPTLHGWTPINAATASASAEPSTAGVSAPVEGNSANASDTRRRSTPYTTHECIFLLEEFEKLGKRSTRREKEVFAQTFNQRYLDRPARSLDTLLAKRNNLMRGAKTYADAIAKLYKELEDQKVRVSQRVLPARLTRDWMKSPTEPVQTPASQVQVLQTQSAQMETVEKETTETETAETEDAETGSPSADDAIMSTE